MSYNILLVDDSRIMRKIIVRTLHQSGLPLGEIYEAGNGDEGLRILDKKLPDIALVDINMPVMGGIEMVDRLRDRPHLKNLPVVFISSQSSSGLIDILVKQGAGYVHKPFTAERLYRIILHMIGRHNGSHA